jgi:endonuclease/exonuclease/phosphatase family metal-dependent hydrolase
MKRIAYFLLVHLLLANAALGQSIAKAADKGDRIELKVTTFNVEWLGCPSYGPDNESLQMRNVAAVIQALNADVVALQEVTMNPTKSLDTVLKHLGSEWGGNIVTWSNNSCSQSQGIVYKKSSVSLIHSALVRNGGTSDSWSSGRFPVLYEVNFLAGENVIPVSIFNIHAKAYSDAQSHSRRVQASASLKALLDKDYKYRKVIVIGDYNDYAEASQCAWYGNCTAGTQSPYKNFADDAAGYRILTSGFTRTIDHITISSGLFSSYVASSATRENAATNSVYDYRNTTSDHTPVSVTFSFPKEYTAVEKNGYSRHVEVYPNPAQHTLYVRSTAENIAAVKVYSLSGMLVYEQKDIHTPQFSISTAAWQSGLYIVSVYSEKGEAGSKLVVKE